jgi:hypothetical protein
MNDQNRRCPDFGRAFGGIAHGPLVIHAELVAEGGPTA